MTSNHFATIGIRVLGVAAIVVGLILAGSSVAMHALGATSAERFLSPDLHLHDTYYVVSHFEQPWLVPGAVSGIVGIFLFVLSRPLGALLARGVE